MASPNTIKHHRQERLYDSRGHVTMNYIAALVSGLPKDKLRLTSRQRRRAMTFNHSRIVDRFGRLLEKV